MTKLTAFIKGSKFGADILRFSEEAQETFVFYSIIFVDTGKRPDEDNNKFEDLDTIDETESQIIKRQKLT